MADDPNAAWGWIPDSWRNAGAGAFGAPDQLGAPVPPPVDDGLAGAPGGQVAPAMAPTEMGIAPPAPDQPPPAIPSFDSALAGGPPAAAQPAPDAFAPPLGAVPPPIDNAIAGGPGAPQLDSNLAALAPPQQPAAAPPLADAISGAAPADAIDLSGLAAGVRSGAGTARDALAGAGETLGVTTPSEQSELSKLTNEQLLERTTNEANAKEADLGAQRAKAARENMEREQRDYSDRVAAIGLAQKRYDQISAEADALSKRQIDPDGRSTFSKIRGVLSAFVNGLVAPYNGGRNVGLEMIQKEIDGNIAAQTKQIENGWKALDMKRGGVAESLARTNDLYVSAEAHRLALYKGALDGIDQQQQQFARDGSTFAKMEVLKRQVRAAAEEHAAKLYGELQKQSIDFVKVNREQQEQALKLEQFKQQKIKDAADIEVAKQNANTSSFSAQTGRLSAVNTAQNAKDELAFKVDELKQKGDTKGAEQLQKFGIVGVTPDDPSQKGAVLAGNATDTEMGPLRDDVAATRSIVDDIDKIMAIRTGGSTKLGNSAEHQQLRAIGGDLLFKLKEANKLKQISDTDMEIFNDQKGFDDPTKFRSFKAGLLQFRQNTIDSANAKLAAHGVAGKIDLPLLPPSVLTDSEKSTAFAGENPSPIPFAASVGGFKGAVSSINDAQVQAVQGKVDEYEAAKTQSERDKIIAQLTELSQTAASEAVRDQALSTLQRLQGASVSLPSEQGAQ